MNMLMAKMLNNISKPRIILSPVVFLFIFESGCFIQVNAPPSCVILKNFQES